MSLSHQLVFTDLLEKLKNALIQFESNPLPLSDSSLSNFDYHAFWVSLESNSRAFSHDVNKLALGFNSSPHPTPDDLVAMTEKMEEKALALLTVLLSVPKHAGRYFISEVQSICVSIIESSVTFVEFLRDGMSSCAEVSDHLVRIGGLWQKCDAIAKRQLPRDNREACLILLEREQSLVADAVRELQEGFDSACGGGDLDEDDDFCDSWSDSERKFVPPGLGLLKTVQALFRKEIAGVRALARLNDQETIADLDGTVEECKNLSALVDEVALCLYPPVQVPEVDKSVSCLRLALLETIRRMERVHFVDKAEYAKWGPFLEKALEHNVTLLSRVAMEHGFSDLSIQHP